MIASLECSATKRVQGPSFKVLWVCIKHNEATKTSYWCFWSWLKTLWITVTYKYTALNLAYSILSAYDDGLASWQPKIYISLIHTYLNAYCSSDIENEVLWKKNSSFLARISKHIIQLLISLILYTTTPIQGNNISTTAKMDDQALKCSLFTISLITIISNNSQFSLVFLFNLFLECCGKKKNKFLTKHNGDSCLNQSKHLKVTLQWRWILLNGTSNGV